MEPDLECLPNAMFVESFIESEKELLWDENPFKPNSSQIKVMEEYEKSDHFLIGRFNGTV